MSISPSYRFAEFHLNPAKRALFRETEEIKLRDKDFEILLLLIESVPETRSHDAIIGAIWNGTSVENNSVEKAIANIRDVLGDDARNPRFIKTVRGKGYLFVGDVVRQELPTITYKPVRASANGTSKAGFSFNEEYSLNRNWMPWVVIACLTTFLLIGTGAYLIGGLSLELFSRRTVIFYDDFSGNSLNRDLWNVKGESVRVQDGIAKAVVEKTDGGAKLESVLFSFDRSRAVVISSRLKVSFSRNLKDRVYFLGGFHITPKTPIYHEAAVHNKYLFGVHYTNTDYESNDPSGDLDFLKVEGFFLSKYCGAPYKKNDYRDGKISGRIEPIWHEWFDQKIVFDPVSGDMSYFINDEWRESFNVGNILAEMDEDKLRLDINPTGWWLHHSIELDYIKVTQ